MTDARPAKRRRSKTKHRDVVIAGWREIVFLPDMSLGPIVAKLDTGARTAALHAINIEVYDSPHGQRVRFDAFIDNTRAHVQPCDLAVLTRRMVKNTGGVASERIVVRSRISLGAQSWMADITLTDRSDMGVPMLLGRTTIKRRFLVHPSKTYLLTAQEHKATVRQMAKPPRKGTS